MFSGHTTAELLGPYLRHSSKHPLDDYIGTHPWNTFIGRRKGTLIWSGKLNLFWFIYRVSGLCGVVGVQVLPPGDVEIGKLIQMFENPFGQCERTKVGLEKAFQTVEESVSGIVKLIDGATRMSVGAQLRVWDGTVFPW
ncbi:uncharacterized protein BO87DRAFT_429960 [Aspergillus neoniger CBS 115656]|uniref:Uncharacterized protein n=1 Tax=Aspergillus neoniger (strain CBS 115656) TaxID=1448310 RepID=A0A318Y940_ASPNB|nr:hypothetical protein BO87DRAFT_429960 [Aspergillus neoniger CBS 115656]PYH30077.1 hypothetical protein BO87DRAFT_429960 [Aspergillus neoniger CBS 115656]